MSCSFSYSSRSWQLAVGLVATMAIVAGPRVWADREEAVRLVTEARELIAVDKYNEARHKLAQAAEADVRYPEIYANLGYLDELTATKEQALAHYGHTLQLQAEHKYARSRFRHLFFAGPFPRWISLGFMKYSPVSVAVDSCQIRSTDLTGPARQYQRRFAYTTSLLFPEEMGRGDPALAIKIPAAGEASGLTAVVNRASYGWVMSPDSDTLRLRFVVQYPSATISSAGKDYAQLAPLLTHSLLRFSLYHEIYLGRRPSGDKEDLVHVYLCEAGPTGAEQYENNIYLYDVARDRSPLEWAREVAHELGHYLLPPVGRFDEPEPLGNGELGERLFLQWLAAETEEVTGERWPSEAAQSALTSLWGGQQMDLGSYIEHQCRSVLDFWLQQGPDSPLIAGASQQSLDYFIGFCLWVQAAHGPGLLAEMLNAAAGNSIADFREAYQITVKRISDQKALLINAGALNLANSQLSHLPQEGAIRREEVKLGPHGVVVLPVFLPRGGWHLSVVCQPEDAQVHLAIQIGEEAIEGTGKVTVAVGAPGWHQVRITAPQAAEEVLLHGLTVVGLPQA